MHDCVQSTLYACLLDGTICPVFINIRKKMHLKINKISIQRLFGFLNYDLQFADSEQLIITGPNGYGKTMILKLIHHAISNNYSELAKIKFGSFDIFTNFGHIRYLNSNTGLQVESFLNETKKIITHTECHISQETIFDNTKAHSILINSMRLNNESESNKIITQQRSDLATSMQETKNKTQKLDTLVDELFSCITGKQASTREQLPDMLKERIVGLQEKLTPYAKLGLLSTSNKYLKIEPHELSCLPRSAASLNEKLSDIFYEVSLSEDFIGRLTLFSELIASKKFAFKTLFINSEVGFGFFNHSKDDIPLELLSSGEKNQVSIFFDLIFNAVNGTLILIDEPEISLHITWQKSLLGEFAKIARFNNYSQLILATHSPDIINDDWHISVDLYDKHEIDTGTK